MPCVDIPSMYLLCTGLYGALTQTTLRIHTIMSTSNPVPNIIKNWNIDGNVTLGKLENRITVFFLQSILYHILFPPHVYTVLYYVSKNWANKPFLIYKGWNFNFGNTMLDWIQALLEWRGNAAARMGPSPTYIHNGNGPSRNGHTQ